MIPRIVIAGACRITARTLVALVPAVDAVAVALGSAGAEHRAGLINRRGADVTRKRRSEGAGPYDAKLAPRFPAAELGVVPDRSRFAGLRATLHAYRTARTYRRCTKILRRVDRAIDRGDRVTAERLMERVRVVLAGVGPSPREV